MWVWARLVVAHRRGWHSHSGRDIHSLPARHRAVPRGQLLPTQLFNGHFPHLHQRQGKKKITLLGKELCTWVEDFFLLKNSKKEASVDSLWQMRKLRGLQYKRPGQWHMIWTHPWTRSKLLCKFISGGGADVTKDTTLFFWSLHHVSPGQESLPADFKCKS